MSLSFVVCVSFRTGRLFWRSFALLKIQHSAKCDLVSVHYFKTMKCTIPEISWHNRDPVLSIDIQPKAEDKNEFYRLATGGTDSHVLVRRLILVYIPLTIMTWQKEISD